MDRAPIDFWFDFISPFGYVASLRIDDIAARHGREVRWHPILIGVTVLKVMGLRPLMSTPLKGDYIAREFERYCRKHGLRLARSIRDPLMDPLPVQRAFAWLIEHASEHALPFARAALHAHWHDGVALDVEAAIHAAGSAAGVPHETMREATSDPRASPLLRAEVEGAIARGVFGSPYFIIDGEPFFGADKLEEIDAWLRSGGW